jgi:hypothetical protein
MIKLERWGEVYEIGVGEKDMKNGMIENRSGR